VADGFEWDVVVRLATQGARQATGEVEGFADAVDEMVRTGKVSEKAAEQASRAIAQQGRASRAAASDTKQMTASVNALRYANYDLGRSLLSVSAGVTAVGVGVVAAAGSFESSFTAVERTSGVVGDAVGELRGELIALTREIPQSFGEITNISARGAQLGIASDQLAEFTEVVAQFVATSDTVSLDQAVEAFGRISNLTGEQDFNALGSAITLVGVNAAATEAQIVKTTQELAPFAAAVGMSTADVIGLSAAVASLGQPPERARSAFLTLQRVVDGAVNGMNDNLGAFASVLGMTEGQVAALWRQDPGEFIQAFVQALGTVDNLTVAFDQLGINERRAVQVFQALAADSRNAGAGLSVLDRAIGDANQGFTEGTELQRQYALILDDLSSKWQIFLNSLMEVAAAIGGNLLPTVKALLDGFTGVAQTFADFAASDIGGVIIRIASSVAILVAAYAGIRGAIALATGAALAFNFVTSATGGASILNGLRGLASAFGIVGASAQGAVGKVTALRGALLALGRATVILGLIQAAIQLVTDFGGSMQWLAQVATNVVNFVGTVFGQLVHFVADAVAAIASITILPGLRTGLQDASKQVRSFAREFEKVGLGDVAIGGFRDWASTLETADSALGNLSSTAAGIPWQDFSDDAADFGNTLGNNVGGGAAGAAREVRTLVDYANDLQSVFSRAFDLRFSGGSTLDAITSTFISIREATEESARNIRKLKAEIQGLQSDLSIQQYFLGIAIEYGDTQRAAAIQANIAKLQADLADKTADLSDEQSKNSKTLVGNSKAAIDNRCRIWLSSTRITSPPLPRRA
jgi:TP901 family phage tail tape measure protein